MSSTTEIDTRPDEKLVYDEVIDTGGVRIPFVPEIITPRIERPLRRGRYEAGEQAHLADIVRQNDRVLDLGAGLGLIATTAAGIATGGSVLSIEAQPDLLPLIRETWALNNVDNAELRHGMIAPVDGPAATFFVRGDFWASSFEPTSRPYVREVEVDQIGIDGLLADFKPTVICCDIEGAELELFNNADLSTVRAIVIETHAKVYGEDLRDGLLAALAEKGLTARQQERSSTVYVLERNEELEIRPGYSTLPEIWPPSKPRILLATCMKDEGPFILEWLAWHKAVGVTDFVVFTNDCTDGTDALLNRLDLLGHVTHLPNPASFSGSTFFQPTALMFVQSMPVFEAADFVLSMDVDEFVNVHVGDGSLDNLLGAVEPFDVLSICELHHGSNGHRQYERGWITEQFQGHGPLHPGRWKAGAGIKSLTRRSDRIEKIRNHRPDLNSDLDDAVWLDGSGNRMTQLVEDSKENGVDSRGRRELVTLEHFSLRSMDSFLVKMHRGDVVVSSKQVSKRYWRIRNLNDHHDHDLSPNIQRARIVHKLFEADDEVMRLHLDCCAAHEARIAKLMCDPSYVARRDELIALEQS